MKPLLVVLDELCISSFKAIHEAERECMLQHSAAAAHFCFGGKHRERKNVVISSLLAGLCESFDGEQKSGQPHYSGLNSSLWFQSVRIDIVYFEIAVCCC